MSPVPGRRSSSVVRAATVRSRLILIDETDSRPAVNSCRENFFPPDGFFCLSFAAVAAAPAAVGKNRPILQLPRPQATAHSASARGFLRRKVAIALRKTTFCAALALYFFSMY